MKIVRVMVAVLLILAAMTLVGHAGFFLNSNLLDYAYRQVSYQRLADHIPAQPTDQETATAVFDHVHKILFAPGGMPVFDDSPWEILSRGYGFCDQQVFLLAAILEKKDIPAQMVFLHDGKREEVHADLEILADGRWIVLDPTNGFVPRNTEGLISTFDELCTDQETLARTEKGKAIDRYIPPEIFNSTGANAFFCFQPRRMQVYGSDKGVLRNAIDAYVGLHQRVFGNAYADLFQDLYLRRQGPGATQQYINARQLQLYERSERAAAAYDALLAAYPNSTVTQDALVFSGLLECERGDFAKGEGRLRVVLDATPGAPDWRMLAAY